MDSFVPAFESRYFPGRAVREGASDEEVDTHAEQVVAQAPGAAGAKHDQRCPSWSGKILILVI